MCIRDSYRARHKRRQALHRRRHKRSVLFGVCAGVLLLLSGSFMLRHFMNRSSAIDTHAALANSAQLVQDTQTEAKDSASVSVEYKTRVEMCIRDRPSPPPATVLPPHSVYVETNS